MSRHGFAMKIFCVLFVALVGCIGCAPPAYLDVPPTRVSANGSTFLVYHRPGSPDVQAYRVNAEFLPSRGRIFAAASIAIEQATGCPVRYGSIAGDQAIVTATVRCAPDVTE